MPNINNNNNKNEFDATSFPYTIDALLNTTNNTTSNTTSIPTKIDDDTSHLSFIFKLISLYLIIPKEFKTAPREKQKQQQQHYHGKQRHQFHLEQQQKQHFKQGHHNVERMVISCVLKLTLVAWDMRTFRIGF
jgi:hypothetical protein